MDIICKTTKRRSESQQEVFTNMRQSSDNNLPLWLQITGKIGWEALAITIIQNENQLRHYNEGLTLCAFTINYLEGNRENKLSYTMLEMGMDCIKSLSKLLSSLKSLISIFFFLGIKNNKTIIDKPSLKIFINTTPVIAIIKECFINLEITVIVKNNRANCSITFDKVLGNILSIPKKYPLIIEEIPIKGSVNPIATNG